MTVQRKSTDPLVRFNTKWRLHKRSGCWRWTAYVNNWGYGLFWTGTKVKCAHVASYEMFVGEIPAGYKVDHVKIRGCRFRDCVNPGHLEAVTHSENIQRSSAGNPKLRKRKQCDRGHKFTPENTGKRSDNGSRYCKTCRRDDQRRHRALAS